MTNLLNATLKIGDKVTLAFESDERGNPYCGVITGILDQHFRISFEDRDFGYYRASEITY